MSKDLQLFGLLMAWATYIAVVIATSLDHN